MAHFAAILERGEDGSWSAYTLSPAVISGTGATKEEALADLRSAVVFWFEFMKETGQPISPISNEIIDIDIAVESAA